MSRPPRTTGDLLDWLSAVLDGLGLTRVDFAGHSYGAMIALAFAIGPGRDRVDRLALVDPTSCYAGLRRSYLLRVLPILLSPTPRRQRRFLDWETGAATLNPEWSEMHCAGARFPTRGPSYRNVLPVSLFRSRRGDSVTVIFAPGSRAHDADTVARRVRELLPSARITMLASGSHHTLPLEPADEIADALVSALEKTQR
ncbi:alpha/beta fold hydrolase [Gordonia terrae]|uniref:alpha/beta fold hydrolase n=1 Tax=Gordonia terrae TaxID=2055 RepID=UPI003F6B61E0